MSASSRPDPLLHLQLQVRPLQVDSPDGLLGELYLNATFATNDLPLLECGVRFGLGGGHLRITSQRCQFLTVTDRLAPPNAAHCRRDDLGFPTWDFQPEELGGGALLGDRPAVILGTLRCERALALDIDFQVDSSDLHLLGVDDFLPATATPNLQAVFGRYLGKFLHSHCIPSPLCQLGLHAPATQAMAEVRAMAPSKSAEAELRAGRERLLQVGHDSFAQLCMAVGLDPHQDFRGANLLGARLTKQDLSESIFTRANLRGAYLCDADLSSSNLSAAKLSGADFSGAQLGSVDLRDSDCHRASFALANLGGADLRRADFRGANLTRANLNGAQIDGLRLGENPGLEASQLAELEARGAIVDARSRTR